MIIDCHTHIGRNEHINSNVDQLLRSMDTAGVDKSFVFAGMLNDISNEYMLEQIAPHKDRLLGVAAYTPAPFGNQWSTEYTRKTLTDLYSDGKIVAVKFYTGYDHYYPSDLYNVLPALNEVGCPAIFHMGDCLNSVKHAKLKYAQPIHIDDVANEYPDMNFIIAHMAYPWVRETAEVCFKNSNVYADISGFVYDRFTGHDKTRFSKNIEEFLDIADSDRLLLGTDFPICNQQSYIETLHWLSDKTLNRQAGEIYTPKYLSMNVERAFKLK